MSNYEQLITKISELAKLNKEEIERRIEGKRAKLSGLVSKEGAAQIVAAELGLNLDRERLKIAQLLQGMKRANTIGKVLEIYPIREFNKNGRSGKVANLLIGDDSSNMKVVLWDTNHISLVENNTISKGDVIEVSNGAIRNGELHLSSFSDIKKSNEIVENVVSGRLFGEQVLKEAKPGTSMKNRALIVQSFEPRYFEVCPECRKKIVDSECAVHGKVKPVMKAILNLILDDGTDSMRAVLFEDQILQLGISKDELYSLEAFHSKKDELIGEEKYFFGNVKQNNFFNNVEFSIEKIENVDPNKLLQELENKKS